MKKVFTLLSAALLTLSVSAGDITVADGTATNASLPVCSYYFDTDFHGQMLYDKAELTAAANSSISTITFYSSTSAQAWGAATVSVKLAEVDATALSGLLEPTFTEVYAGTCSIVGGELTFTLTTPFAYSGTKNLLIDVLMTKKGTATYSDLWFYGQEVTGAGYSTRDKQGTYTYTSAVINFRPKTTFGFSGGEISACEAPTKLKGTATPDGGIFTWEGEADTRYQWCAVEKDAEAAGWALLESNVFTCTATGLTTGKEYDFYVRTYCSESLQSEAKKVSFTPACNAPADIQLLELGATSASFAWEAVAGVSQYQFACVPSGATPEWDGVAAKEVLTAATDTLYENTAYDFYVRSYFSASVQSEPAKLSFTTDCAVKSLPLREAFMNAGLPACWTVINNSSYMYGWNVVTVEEEGGTFMRYNSRGANGITDTLGLPAINLTENSFIQLKVLNPSALEVKLLVSTDGGATCTELADFTDAITEWKTKEVGLAEYSGIINLYFIAAANGKSNYFDFDNLKIAVGNPQTAIEQTLNGQSSNRKLIKDGRLVIEHNGVRYNAQGAVVE